MPGKVRKLVADRLGNFLLQKGDDFPLRRVWIPMPAVNHRHDVCSSPTTGIGTGEKYSTEHVLHRHVQKAHDSPCRTLLRKVLARFGIPGCLGTIQLLVSPDPTNTGKAGAFQLRRPTPLPERSLT